MFEIHHSGQEPLIFYIAFFIQISLLSPYSWNTHCEMILTEQACCRHFFASMSMMYEVLSWLNWITEWTVKLNESRPSLAWAWTEGFLLYCREAKHIWHFYWSLHWCQLQLLWFRLRWNHSSWYWTIFSLRFWCLHLLTCRAPESLFFLRDFVSWTCAASDLFWI